MKLSKIATGVAFVALLSAPLATLAGGNFEQAKKEATAEIDNAKAAGYEWRDSRKILKKAEKAEKAGNHEEAIKLANQAKKQGINAVAQADIQKNAGPH